MCAEQLPLDFDFRPSLEGADFLVAPSNEQAVQWLDRWPHWPSPFLLICGPKSCGKTHLSKVFLNATGGQEMTLSSDPYESMADFKVGVVEDIDRIVSNQQNELFHLYNFAKENGCYVLLTAEISPEKWGVKLADLKSRLATMPIVEIEQPDDILLEALMEKLFSDRQLMVEREVMTYILSRIERSFEATVRIVERIDTFSLKNQRKITIPLVRNLLQK